MELVTGGQRSRVRGQGSGVGGVRGQGSGVRGWVHLQGPGGIPPLQRARAGIHQARHLDGARRRFGSGTVEDVLVLHGGAPRGSVAFSVLGLGFRF